jgi:AcrR family transcriptional regulator
MSRRFILLVKKKKVESERIRLSRDAVIQAAIELAGQIGIDALSMRKLAETLGVEAMSLYNHVKNKEDLLDAMVDTVVGEMYLPNIKAAWRQEIRKAALSSHKTLMQHSWASLLLVSRPSRGVSKLKHFDATQGCFCHAGFNHQMADQVRNVIDGHLYGFTLQKLLCPTAEGDYAQAAAQCLPMLPQDLYPHSRALVEQVAGGNYDGQHYFEFGLDLLLDSIENILTVQLEKNKPSKTSRPRSK